MRRNLRMKAPKTYFNNTDHWLGSKTSRFSDAFPEIKKVKVEVQEWDFGTPLHTHYYTEPSLGEYINCSNERCFNGGFRTGEQLRFMTETKEARKNIKFPVRGTRAVQKESGAMDRATMHLR